MIEEGIVIRTGGGRALVHFTGDGCSGCASKGCCMAGSGGGREMDVVDTIGAAAGQKVAVEIVDRKLFIMIGLFYLVPTVIFITGLVAGYALHDFFSLQKDLLAFCVAASLCVIYFITLRLHIDKVKFFPYIAKIVE